MYAVIETGGKQYKVTEGDEINVEKLQDIDENGKITFSNVLLVVGDNKEVVVGNPYIENASVVGKVLREEKGKKVIVFKFKRRKGYKKKKGHRQTYSRVLIERIIK